MRERTMPRRSVKSAPPMSRRERRMLLRLVCSAALLLLTVGLKLTAPELTARLRADFMQAVSAEIDVQEVFAAVGRSVSGEGEWQEVYRAVFSPGKQATEVSSMGEPETPASAALYNADNTPETVCMTQQVLGFAYIPPLEGATTSAFGLRESPVSGEEEFHYGVDLAAEEGTSVRCFADGTVKAVGDSGSLGHYLIVEHEGGYSTLYAHCKRILAASGDAVSLGETIAEVGQSGNATGPHLHFVLSRGSTYLNPVYYL